MTLILAGNKEPVSHQAGQFETFVYRNKAEGYQGVATEKAQVSALFTYKLEMNDNLDMVYSATNQGYDSTFAYLNEALYQPVSIFQAAEQKTRRLLSENLMITSPDPEFNMGYRWALVATDRFFVNTPGMGKALVAGYATTRHGWDGGHAINGRPGYGWYFGRDAQWSGLALCDYGDFSKVKSQLQFFNRFQDLNGKIFHEASTSGLIHYDAADATPLYIVLAGKYFRHSYDTAFIRSTWPYIKKAINFCFSTDTDQDKLIENTNVGHGWVEGGKLYGSHSTIYMAGAWGAALKEASQMGKFLKDPDTEYYFLESQEQSNLINHLFWGENQRFYAYGMDKDKSFRHVQTILPAVPIYFRMTDPEKSAVCTREYAGNAFTTNWGARILREDNPWFKPTGYHYGSVWPLFTGWAALADYATGNSISGFAHLMNNLSVYKNWGLGFVEEVLNGANYEPSGVCPHQCWSETMVLQPAIEGMLGLQVNAPQKSLILAPSLPSDWDSLKAEHIRAGDAIISFQYQRKDNKYTYHFNLTGAPMMKINFFPALPPGTEVGKVYLDGEAILVSTYSTGPSQNLSLAFDLKGHSVLTFEYSGGISVLPVVQAPRPGDQAEGLRILSTRYYRNTYQAEVEGLSGSSESLRLWSDFPVESFSENLTPIGKEDKLTGYQIRFQPSETKYQKMILTWKVKRDEP
jgi:glycogen debranching enzyme